MELDRGSAIVRQRDVAMAELFQKDVWTINEHPRNIYEEGKLDAERTAPAGIGLLTRLLTVIDG